MFYILKKFLLLLSCFVSLAAYAKSYNIETYRVFGPEHSGQYKHPASITQLSNGDLYIAYYGGSGEYGDDTAVYGARKKKGESNWSLPSAIADTPDRSEGNPVIWQGPNSFSGYGFFTRQRIQR